MSNFQHWETLRQTAVWTSKLQTFIKNANVLILYFESVKDAPSWMKGSSIVRVKMIQAAKGSEPERTEEIEVAGAISAGYQNKIVKIESDFGAPYYRYCQEEENVYRPLRGMWYLPLYPEQSSHAYSCLRTITSNSKVEFRVRLDLGTNSHIAQNKLHVDVLELVVNNKQHWVFNLDSYCCPHDLARFGETIS